MKPVAFMTIDQINDFDDYDHVKFVKVAGKYRFASTSTNWMVNHTDMVEAAEFDAVEGAGTIELANKKWKLADRDSSTLRRAGVKNHRLTDAMEAELNQMIKHEYDVLI